MEVPDVPHPCADAKSIGDPSVDADEAAWATTEHPASSCSSPSRNTVRFLYRLQVFERDADGGRIATTTGVPLPNRSAVMVPDVAEAARMILFIASSG